MTNETAFKAGLVFGMLYIGAVLLCLACWQLNRENERLQGHLMEVQKLAVVKQKYQHVPIEDQPDKA